MRVGSVPTSLLSPFRTDVSAEGVRGAPRKAGTEDRVPKECFLLRWDHVSIFAVTKK